MNHALRAAVGGVAIAIAMVPAANAAAPKRVAKFTLKSVTKGPSSAEPGGTFDLTAKVTNAKKRRTSSARLTFSLLPTTGVKRAVHRERVHSTKGGRSRTVKVKVVLPTNLTAGTYTLRACIRRGAGIGKAHCRTVGKITITLKPKPQPQPSPPPAVTADNAKNAITAAGLRNHLLQLQDAANLSGGNRASGLQGYGASLYYVVNQLRAAGYNPTVQTFDFLFFRQLSPSTMVRSAPAPKTYVEDTDFATMSYSGSGDTTVKTVTPVDLALGLNNTSTSGCEDADFAGFPAGNIALVQRGTCPFGDKAANAEQAGASGVIVMNQGNTSAADRQDLFAGTLGNPVGIPAVSVSYANGVDLQGGDTVRITTETQNDTRSTANVIAETPGGNPDKVVLVGSHLDSVPEGPGINDNGTGSAFNLEMALQMAKMQAPANKVRFAWWGAEEEGLIGSTHYAGELSDADFGRIMLNLNFDMLGSPNHAVLVYDGDFSNSPPPATAPTVNPGAVEIEALFNNYFAANGIPAEPTAFDGRSDYKAFQDGGRPAGGLFTGAEVPKTAAQAAKWGGLPDVAFDPNYHGAGDTINNVDLAAFEQMAKAAAYATGTYASRTLNAGGGAAKQRASGKEDAVSKNVTYYRGDKLTR